MMLALLVIALAGCQSSAAACAPWATLYQGNVAASFTTDVGSIRRLFDLPNGRDRWPGVGDDRRAVLCYVDGGIPKAPPAGKPFDRAVIAIVDGHGELILAGYRDSLPIREP